MNAITRDAYSSADVRTEMNSAKTTARLAGVFYLLIVICGGFAELVVRDRIVVPGNAAETARHILASERLFRNAFIADLVMMMSYLLLGLTLYALLKGVDKNVARLMVAFNLIGVPIIGLNMLNHFASVYVLDGADYLKVFSPEQLDALALFFLNLHSYGYIIAQVSTGTWLLPLGYLVYKSGFIPKILGVLLMIASAGYLVDLLAQFLLPDYAGIIEVVALAPASLGELAFLLWLLVRGTKTKQVMVI